MKQLLFLILSVYSAASISPPEIVSTPANVRLGSQVMIQCKPNRDSISQLTTILMIDPYSSIIISAARVVSDEPFRLAYKQAGVDSTLTSEGSLPVISVNFPRVSFQNAGKYTCKLGFTDLSQNNTEYNLLVWEAPGTPSAPLIEPADVSEGTVSSVTCRGDVGYPLGSLQLVSNGARLNGFVPVAEGCGAIAPTCYRYDRMPSLTDGRNAENRWSLPQASVLDDGLQFWCRALHDYAPEKPLSSTASTLRVLYAPRDMKLHTSNGRISPLQSNVGFELKPQDSAWIECSAVGNPPPSVRWLLGPNQTLNASAYSLNGSRLVLRDAALLAATSARFVCEASNSINSQTKTATLTVTIKITIVKVPEETSVAKPKADAISTRTASPATPRAARAGQMGDRSTLGGSSVGTVIVVVVLVVLVLVAAVFVLVVVYIFVCRKQQAHDPVPVSERSAARNGRNGATNGKSKADTVSAQQALIQEKARQAHEGTLVAEVEDPAYAQRDSFMVSPMPAPSQKPPQVPTHYALPPDQKNDIGSFV